MAPRDCAVVGRWRIVASDLWGRDDLDLVGLATMVVGERGHGEITVGALTAALDLEYARTSVFFRWHGSDDMTEVNGDGAAELQDDGSLEIELNYQNCDEVTLKRPPRGAFFNSLLVHNSLNIGCGRSRLAVETQPSNPRDGHLPAQGDGAIGSVSL